MRTKLRKELAAWAWRLALAGCAHDMLQDEMMPDESEKDRCITCINREIAKMRHLIKANPKAALRRMQYGIL
jgi:hypothetical protein